MNRYAAMLGLALIVAACAHAPRTFNGLEVVSYKTMLSRNLLNVRDISIGMDKSQVVATMGEFVAETRNSMAPNPYHEESFKADGHQYEVMYYMTKKYPPFRSIDLSQSTPVVLEDGKVIGLGFSAVRRVK